MSKLFAYSHARRAIETAYTICDIHYWYVCWAFAASPRSLTIYDSYFNFVAHYNDPKIFENVIW